MKKAEKKYKNLLDDADDLQKRKRKIEQQIDDNFKDQKNQQSEVDKQRQIFLDANIDLLEQDFIEIENNDFELKNINSNLIFSSQNHYFRFQ